MEKSKDSVIHVTVSDELAAGLKNAYVSAVIGGYNLELLRIRYRQNRVVMNSAVLQRLQENYRDQLSQFSVQKERVIACIPREFQTEEYVWELDFATNEVKLFGQSERHTTGLAESEKPQEMIRRIELEALRNIAVELIADHYEEAQYPDSKPYQEIVERQKRLFEAISERRMS